jgi:hypothetical protein
VYDVQVTEAEKLGQYLSAFEVQMLDLGGIAEPSCVPLATASRLSVSRASFSMRIRGRFQCVRFLGDAGKFSVV